MLGGLDPAAVGLGLIALAVAAFAASWYGRRRTGLIWLSRAGTLIVVLIVVGLVVLVGYTVATEVGD